MTRRHDCKGNPSVANYGNGCRCDLCRSAKALYEKERRARVDSGGAAKKPSGNRDKPVPEPDAFTREQILRARGMASRI